MRRVFVVLLAVIAVSAYSQTGVIRQMTGEVELKPAGSANFVRAQTGSEIAADTIISTGFRSSALIAIGSTLITVRPLTMLSLADITKVEGLETLNVNLQTGRIRVEVKPPAGARANTNVRSPSATASVRGTVFEMDARNITVTEGNVNWRDSSGFSTTVKIGFSGSINSTGGAVDPIEIAQSDFIVTAPVGSGDAEEKLSTENSSSVSNQGKINLKPKWQ